MIRRSLRIGIRLGMLAGLVFALFKIAEARRPLPAGPGDDPWAPPRQPEPERAPGPARPTAAPGAAAVAPPVDEGPALVEPTMLQSTSLRRLPSRADDRAFDPASTAPPVVSPADPFAPPAVATPSPSPLVAAEIEPDDDEIVILSTSAPEPAPPPTSAAPERQTRATGPEKAPAKKAAARTAATTKSPTAKSPTAKLPTTKSPARKSPTGKVAAKKAAPDTPARKRPGSKKVTWVEPDGGVCPTTHPVKAKLRSAIFHLPGMAAYARTNPDRCYRDEAAALDDGLRKAAR